MSKYILVHNQHNYTQNPGWQNVRHDDVVSLEYFDHLDDFYHYMVDLMISCGPYDGDTEDTFDIVNYLDEDITSMGLDQDFTLFVNGEEKPIFRMGPSNKTNFRNLEELCLGIKKIEEVVKFSKFLKESKKEVFPNIKKFNIDDFVVIVGRDAKSNDHLTFMLADEDDIWMHTKGVPGSHVIIKVKDKLPTREIIKKAAEMAKKNSKASKMENTTVVYCKRKFVKKSPDMNPGQVSVDYKNAEEINI